MGDFFVDDQFYDHPKAHLAGEDAANLCVRGWAWAHRHNTGLIPKNAVATLTTKKNHAQLAQRLVEVRLWHDEGDCYRMHDWEIRNAKSIAKREAGRKGAEVKWQKYRETQKQTDATADATAVAKQCEPSALPTKEPRNQGTKEVGNGCANTHAQQSVAVAAAPHTEPDLIETALNLLVDRRMLASRAEIVNPSGYRTVTLAALRAEHDGTLAELRDLSFADAHALADYLEPAPPRRATSVGPVSTFEAFHELGCVCAGHGTNRTCKGAEEGA